MSRVWKINCKNVKTRKAQTSTNVAQMIETNLDVEGALVTSPCEKKICKNHKSTNVYLNKWVLWRHVCEKINGKNVKIAGAYAKSQKHRQIQMNPSVFRLYIPTWHWAHMRKYHTTSLPTYRIRIFKEMWAVNPTIVRLIHHDEVKKSIQKPNYTS